MPDQCTRMVTSPGESWSTDSVSRRAPVSWMRNALKLFMCTFRQHLSAALRSMPMKHIRSLALASLLLAPLLLAQQASTGRVEQGNLIFDGIPARDPAESAMLGR